MLLSLTGSVHSLCRIEEFIFTHSKSWATIPHAVHMPSHVFTKLGSFFMRFYKLYVTQFTKGMWKHSWITNMKAFEMSLAYAEDDPYNERFHALGNHSFIHCQPTSIQHSLLPTNTQLEFASYALLQMGQISEAEKLIRIVTSMTPDRHYPYDSILIPARFYLESRQYLEAANMQLLPSQFPWEQYPGAFVILYYTRVSICCMWGGNHGNSWLVMHIWEILARQKHQQ
jgi:hypothetical protein